jgi:hypothetical protein
VSEGVENRAGAKSGCQLNGSFFERKVMNEPNETNYTDCYVAFLDILGFKKIAIAHSHEHLK